ncbi:MAG: bifunctional phosphopantothenoylcysteine decarboxylase/phosphopantothenate--cysteine ligase CoaBC [Pseudomonadota bacterium]
MASITIRNLDEKAKEALRLRAARNGHSMEEEVRRLLSDQAGGSGVTSDSVPSRDPQSSTSGDLALSSKTILLIIAGGIAAYKSLDLIRRLRERGATVQVIMTKAAQEFVTPLAAGALAANGVFTDLFDREDEQDVGHIRLARGCDAIVVAPATADLMAKVANGLADDLASTVLAASRGPVLFAPAMNPAMWSNPATRRNHELLIADGHHFIGPERGEMAESGEAGLGRMSEPLAIADAVQALLDDRPKPLAGKHVVLTSGPTHEPIDPVRYIANRSSGKQGHAIAAALAELGADVTLVSGPVNIAAPQNVKLVPVETARQMKEAVHTALPADIGVFVAAVADWRTASAADQKMKKDGSGTLPVLELTENPDILRSVGTLESDRPELVIGFAAETDKVKDYGKAKLARKGADWIVANDVSVSADGSGVMGGDENTVHLITSDDVETWPTMSKDDVARKLAQRIADHFA